MLCVMDVFWRSVILTFYMICFSTTQLVFDFISKKGGGKKKWNNILANKSQPESL